MKQGEKIVIVWPGFTGYMAGAWKALDLRARGTLASTEGGGVKIYIEPSKFESKFDGSDLEGLDWKRVEGEAEFERVVGEIKAIKPDLVMSAGWGTPLCRLVGKTDFGCKKIFCFDMPWEGRFRQYLARWVLRPFLRHFDVAFVPGSRAERYAKWLGFKKIVRGCNPSGWERFGRIENANRRFLFAGRFSAEKGLDVLVKAYAKYRAMVENPWGLDLVGTGDALPEIGEGVEVKGFVEPQKMPQVVGAHAAFVLPSSWETWGISAMEAMCAGLCVIATDAVGFTSDINPTVLVKSGDVEGLAQAMRRVHEMTVEEREEEAMRLRGEAEKYSDARWAERVLWDF